jgi:hypothetical protein
MVEGNITVSSELFGMELEGWMVNLKRVCLDTTLVSTAERLKSEMGPAAKSAALNWMPVVFLAMG